MKPKKILLYIPMIYWYQQYGLKIAFVHQLVEYQQVKSLPWFPKEAVNTIRAANENPEDLGDVSKLKGNSFCEKMIDELGLCKNTKFARDKWDVSKAIRSLLFDNLENIGAVYVMKKF